MHLVKRLWELYESWVTSFVQLSCIRWNENESCMRVEWPIFFNSHVLGQRSMKIVWELSEQFCSTLLYLVKWAWKLYESWVTTLVQLSCTRSNEHDSCMRVEWPLLFTSHAVRSNDYESSMRVEWPVLFNSHVLGQMSMKIVWELSDQFCSTLMHSVKRAWKLYESWVTSFVQLALMHLVKRAWQLYESWVTRFVHLSCTRSNEQESSMKVKWPVLFNSHALGQTTMGVEWPALFNSHALGQTSMRAVWELSDRFCSISALAQMSMRVVWELSDKICSSPMHLVKGAWTLYES